MTFQEVLDQTLAMLQRQGRVSNRALRRQFDLDDEYLADLRFELIEVLHAARDEGGEILVWTGDAAAQAPERRQLTVMFCDLADSTVLSSRLDPEDLREVVRAYQQASVEAIQGLGGYVAQYLGDGLLVYFGYPHAHEDDAQRAVRAGLGIVESIAALNDRLEPHHDCRLAVRVGIHTGPVVVGQMGAGERHEQLALGETPNVAARVQGLAEPDTVMISAATHRLVQGYFDCDGGGVRDLKGIAKPMAVYRVLHESGARGRLDAAMPGGLTPFVGREAELAGLLGRWREATEGRGQVVLVRGEPGIGKSRLVHELKTCVAKEQGGRVEFRGSPYHQNSVLHPVVDQLERRLGMGREDSPAERLGRLEKLLASFALPLSEAIPLIAPLLSLPLPARYPLPSFSPETQRQKTRETLVRCLLAEAAAQPLLVVAEDLHWADPSTLELFGLLVDRVPAARMLVVASFRPDFHPPWSVAHVASITLERFGGEQVEEIIGKVTGERTLPSEVVREVVARTDGVPLFVEELTKMLLESAPSAALAIPATLQDSLMARLDRLGTGKPVAQLGAVLGREFAYDLLREVSPWDEATLRRGLGELVEAELVHQRGQPPNPVYVFKHALIQDAAYQSLFRSTRQEYHARTAGALAERFTGIAESQPELVAHHCVAGGLHGEAIEYLDRANDKATGANALVEAVRYFEEALRLLDAEPSSDANDRRRLRLLFRQLPVFRGLFRYREYHELLERHEATAARLGDPVLQAALDARLGHCEYAVGEYDRAIARLERAAVVCEAHDQLADAALAYMAWAWAAMLKSDFEDAVALSDQALRVTARQFHLQYCVWSRYVRSVSLTLLGRWAEATAEADRALVDAERYDDDGCRVMAWAALALAHTHRGDLARGVEYGTKAVAKAPTPVDRSVALVGLGAALCFGEGPQQGIDLLAPLVAIARAARHRSIEITAVALGEGYLRTGDLKSARATLEEVVRLADAHGIRYAACRAHRTLGEVALAENPAQVEAPLAAPAFERSLALARAIASPSEVALTLAAYGRLLKRLGRVAEARRHLGEALELFERLGALTEPDRVRRDLTFD